MQRLFSLVAVLALLAGLFIALPATAAPSPWSPNTPYQIGSQVTYGGLTYECIQAHTSQTGWEPPYVPALWKAVQGTAPTATTPPPTSINPTATPKPPATATIPPVSTITPQPTSTGSCSAPTWNRSAIYTNGNVISHNNNEWKALWWTQGEEPGVTTSGVWAYLRACSGGATATPVIPTVTSTPRPTVVNPTATPIGPTPTPCGTCGGGLPSRLLVGYWHNFDNGSGFIRLRDVSLKYDVINVAFAEPNVPNGSTMVFTPDPATTIADFKADIAYLHSQGKKVLISIGGANAVVDISTATGKQNYTTSMIAIIREYGFDGMDIDLEHGVSIGGSEDFRNPTSPQIVNLIGASRAIADAFGPGFILTMAPETAYVQGGYATYGSIWGAYLPIIYGLRDKLTYIHVQHYNSGSIEALDGRAYSQGTADFHVAMAEMLLKGFPVGRNTNNMFPALRPDQVAIGLPASPSGASGGYTAPAEVQKALNYLIKGQSFGGSYVLRTPGGYPQFRGLMTWSINWDRVNGYQFANSHRTYLDSLPR